ncbi:hypothetical protein LMIY3S_02729 [Labrys miyagiensis]
MSDNLDGTYAVVVTSSTGCLAGVCVICGGQLDGNDFEGGRYRGDVRRRDDVVELNITMEGPTRSSRAGDNTARQLFRLKEAISAREWIDGGTIFLKDSGVWLIMRQIASAPSVGSSAELTRRAA